jgi:6-phosphofructokinase 1
MKPIVLTPKTVDGIQLEGGTVLGTSRGGANMKEIVKRIDMWGIDMLFVVGGNGGNAGANAIDALCQQHEVRVPFCVFVCACACVCVSYC